MHGRTMPASGPPARTAPRTKDRSKRIFLLAAALFLFVVPGAHATSSFGYSGESLDVQFVGRDFQPTFNGTIEVSTGTGPRTLPVHSYMLSDYRFGESLRLDFRNPGDESLPSSFTLIVVGARATLETGGLRLGGHFTWES